MAENVQRFVCHPYQTERERQTHEQYQYRQLSLRAHPLESAHHNGERHNPDGPQPWRSALPGGVPSRRQKKGNKTRATSHGAAGRQRIAYSFFLLEGFKTSTHQFEFIRGWLTIFDLRREALVHFDPYHVIQLVDFIRAHRRRLMRIPQDLQVPEYFHFPDVPNFASATRHPR